MVWSQSSTQNFAEVHLASTYTKKTYPWLKLSILCVFFPNFLWMKGWNFQCRKAVEAMFFLGGKLVEHDWSWTCLPRKQDSDFELSLAHYRQIWGDRWGWSLNDKGAVFRYNFLDVLTVTFPSISWFVSNTTIVLQDWDHEVGQWIRIVRDDYHLINHPFKQQNLPWSWAAVQQSTYFFGLLKWAVCGLRMVISWCFSLRSWVRMLRLGTPWGVQPPCASLESGCSSSACSSARFFSQQQNLRWFLMRDHCCFLKPTPCFFLRIIIKKFKGAIIFKQRGHIKAWCPFCWVSLFWGPWF